MLTARIVSSKSELQLVCDCHVEVVLVKMKGLSLEPCEQQTTLVRKKIGGSQAPL